MYLFHSTVRVKLGRESEFEQSGRDTEAEIAGAPGFVRRLLLKDMQNRGKYFYISMWESFDHIQDYRAQETTKARVNKTNDSEIMDGSVERVECELVSFIDLTPVTGTLRT